MRLRITFEKFEMRACALAFKLLQGKGRLLQEELSRSPEIATKLVR